MERAKQLGKIDARCILEPAGNLIDHGGRVTDELRGVAVAIHLNGVDRCQRLCDSLGDLRHDIDVAIGEKIGVLHIVICFRLSLDAGGYTLAMCLFSGAVSLTLEARRLCLSLCLGRNAFSRLLGTVEIGVRLILRLDLGSLGILGTRVELGIRFLLGGIAVSLSLLTDRGIQLALLHGNLALGEFDLLGLGRDLRLLLCDIELTLLFSRHGLLDHVCLSCSLVGSLLQLSLLQIELVLSLGDLLLRPDLGELSLLLDLSCLVGTHRADNPLRIGEILDVERAKLKTEICKIVTRTLEYLMVEGLAVTHEFLQIHLTDNLSHLSEHDLGDLTGHLGLIHIEIILRCYLDQFGSLPNLEVCDGASMDKNRILCRDLVLRRQLNLHSTESQRVHTLQTGDNERALSRHAARLAESRYDHQLVRRTLPPTGLEHDDHHDHD